MRLYIQHEAKLFLNQLVVCIDISELIPIVRFAS
jgi:hypothetical protein